MADKQRRRAQATARFQQRANTKGTDLSLVTSDVGKGRQPKAVDVGYDFYSFQAAADPPTPQWLSRIKSGTLDEQRIGTCVTARSLEIRGRVEYFDDGTGSADPPQPGIMRMVVVYDRQPNGVIPDWREIFASRDTDGNPDESVMAFQDLDTLARFVVLWDKLWDAGTLFFRPASLPQFNLFPATGNPGNGCVDVRIDFGEGLPLRYDAASTGNYSDALSGSLFAIFCCDDNLDEVVKFKGGFRLHFTDD